MSDFTTKIERFQGDGLSFDYFLVPWDAAIINRPVVDISNITLQNIDVGSADFARFANWCNEQDVALCSCRIEHAQILLSMFLESQGFRFIELNYRPYLDRLQDRQLSEDTFSISEAQAEDEDALAAMSATIFNHGRFHQDPHLGAAVGNKRYEQWLRSAFSNPHQRVLKCQNDEQTIGFFVIEQPAAKQIFWSLVGLAPGLSGKGLGKRLWRHMLHWHQRHGVEQVSTSISSHNLAILNLYAALDFRFPQPTMTLHWHPSSN